MGQQEAIGSLMKHHKVSKSFRGVMKLQEASGSIRKAQHKNNNNKKENTQADSKKHC